MQELQEVSILAAKTPKDVQQRAKERSGKYNVRIATELQLAKDARAKYINMKKMECVQILCNEQTLSFLSRSALLCLSEPLHLLSPSRFGKGNHSLPQESSCTDF